MRVAVSCDIHANLPALEAVLKDVRLAGVDQVVVGGDILPGPMPVESLALLCGLDIPVKFILGNGELAVFEQVGDPDPATVTYWGTTSGEPLPEPLREVLRWTARQIHPQYDDVVRAWPKTLRFEIPGLDQVLFCHGTPRSETECFTRLTPEDRLAHVFEDVGVPLVEQALLHPPSEETMLSAFTNLSFR